MAKLKTASTNYKFTWVPNTKKVTRKDRPRNELNQKKGYIDQTSIEELGYSFTKTNEYQLLIKKLQSTDYIKSCKGKPQRFDQMPKMDSIAIRHLMSALAVQRHINFVHLERIITSWDSRRPAVINVIRLPGTNVCYITDGQHTALAIAIRAKLGLFPDINPADWLDIKINCQVVETDDFSFAREHFLGINGADKLPIIPFETHKIHVFGKRLDSPDAETQEKYERACQIQTELERWNTYPVHPDSPDRFKPGALIHCNLLPKIDVADATFFGENHYLYWPQEPVDPMEILPFQNLRKRLLNEGADFDHPDHKQFMEDINALVKEVAGGWPEFKNITQQVYPRYHSAAYEGEKASSCPADASLALLMQLYKRANGKYKYVPASLLSRYRESNTELFDHLEPGQKKKFK